MKIILIGGHLSPLISVIQELKKEKETELLVIGRKHALEGDSALSLEYQTVNNLGIAFKTINTGRLQRKWTRYTLFSLLKFPCGLIQSCIILYNFKPDIIFSFGGYVSLPVVLAGFILKIPIVIHEQTIGAGFSNRIAALMAKKVLIAWGSSMKFFPRNKTILVGNPLRKEIVDNLETSSLNFRKNKKTPLIYITGGSLGSHVINLLIEHCIKKLLNQYYIFQQTGDAKKYQDFARLQKIREKLPEELKTKYFLTKFIDTEEINSVLREADLVISRSGINIITELMFLEKPAILIPLNKEQRENALFFKSLGLGEVVNQEKINPDELCQIVKFIFSNLEKYKRNAKEANKKIEKNAVKKIIEILKQEAKRSISLCDKR